MRNDQIRFVDHLIPEQHEIEVERSCGPSRGAHPPTLAFNRHEGLQELARSLTEAADHCRIQE